MGQKTNLNIFQINEKNNWKLKCCEKKITENSIYLKKNIEIWNFIDKFFKNHCIIINNCKLLYLNWVLQIYLSYYCNLTFFFEKKKSNIKIKKLKNNIFINIFLRKLFLSLTNFFWKKFDFFLVIQKLKNNFKKTINNKTKRFLQKKLTNFRKYKQATFFENGINILVTCINNNKTSKLLAKFLTSVIRKLKHHNFFIRFIWNILKILIISSISKIKRMHINIKGCLNGRPKAITKNFEFNQSVSLTNYHSKINYFQEIAYGLDGTIGVKVWIDDLF